LVSPTEFEKMSSSVLDSVLEIQRQRAEAAEQAFRDLVQALASNPKVPPSAESIDSILIASRHSVDDLATAVKLVQRRESLRQEIRDIDARQSDRAALVAKVEAANAELEAAKAKHRETTFPIQKEIDSIDQMHHNRQAAERELRSLIDDDAAEQIDQLGRQVQAAAKARDNQQRLVRELQSRLSSSDEGVRTLAVGQVKRGEEALAALTAECDDLVRRQSELLASATLG